MSLTKGILRPILRCGIRLGNKAADVPRRICSSFGETSVSEGTAEKLFSRFSSAGESLEDKPRVGRPSILDKAQLEEEIKQNPNKTCQKLAQRFEVSDETIHSHLHNLGMTWKFIKCLPHVLSKENML